MDRDGRLDARVREEEGAQQRQQRVGHAHARVDAQQARPAARAVLRRSRGHPLREHDVRVVAGELHQADGHEDGDAQAPRDGLPVRGDRPALQRARLQALLVLFAQRRVSHGPPSRLVRGTFLADCLSLRRPVALFHLHLLVLVLAHVGGVGRGWVAHAHLAVVKVQDLGGPLQDRAPVRHDDARLVGEQPEQAVAHHVARDVRVQAGEEVVEQVDLLALVDRPGQCDAHPLAAGQRQALVAHEGLVAAEAVEVLLQRARLHHRVVEGLVEGLAPQDVAADGAALQPRVLRHVAEARGHVLQGDRAAHVAHVAAVHDRGQDGALPAADVPRHADQVAAFLWTDGERESVSQ